MVKNVNFCNKNAEGTESDCACKTNLCNYITQNPEKIQNMMIYDISNILISKAWPSKHCSSTI